MCPTPPSDVSPPRAWVPSESPRSTYGKNLSLERRLDDLAGERLTFASYAPMTGFRREPLLIMTTTVLSTAAMSPAARVLLDHGADRRTLRAVDELEPWHQVGVSEHALSTQSSRAPALRALSRAPSSAAAVWLARCTANALAPTTTRRTRVTIASTVSHLCLDSVVATADCVASQIDQIPWVLRALRVASGSMSAENPFEDRLSSLARSGIGRPGPSRAPSGRSNRYLGESRGSSHLAAAGTSETCWTTMPTGSRR